MCCAGCTAVAEAIDKAGLSNYYKHRTENSLSQRDLVPKELEQLQVYDHEDIQKSFVTVFDKNRREARLVLEGIQCAACVWLNQRHLNTLPGVVDTSVNYSTHQATIVWDNDRIKLSEILAAIRAIGYEAHPYDPNRQQLLVEQQRRQLLKQIGVAAALGMQVMILAVTLYNGDWYGMEPVYESFFRRFSLLLTLPVLLYSGKVFFRTAFLDLRLRRVSMDVPVSLGIGLAFSASTYSVIRGYGTIYFESVCMFILFLLAARYFELVSRSKAMIAAQGIGYVKPAMARRYENRKRSGDIQMVAALELETDDILQVRPGDIIPADGEVLSGRSGVDESILTGESLPVLKTTGSTVIGGSTNTESPLTVRVTRTGGHTILAEIHRLLDDAVSGKPAIGRLADRIAGYFVSGVLVVTAVVAGFWWSRGADDWLEITVAVLVVSCPCALSLAVPTAISSAITALMRSKILVTSERALETLPKATLFVFDKTGTLTAGRPRVAAATSLRGNPETNLRIAGALESASEHPVARAIRKYCDSVDMEIRQIENIPGAGLSGWIGESRYWIGSPSFIKQQTHVGEVPGLTDNTPCTRVVLADRDNVLCIFTITDQIRADSIDVIRALDSQDLRTAILSGDNAAAVEHVATTLGIDLYESECTPQQKLDTVSDWQQNGEIVAMIGDGVNDAPVMAGANVSVSVAGATPIAVANSDIVCLSNRIDAVQTALDTSKRATRIMKQNLYWALGYNSIAIPAAAAGLIAPWLAALGMSASSLIVIANASRLRSVNEF